MPFQKGHRLAKGGARPNSGPPKEEVRLKFQKMLEDSGAHKRFQKILEQEPNTEIFLKAYQISLDRAWGKPNVAVEVSGDVGLNLGQEILKNRKERGLDDAG